MAKRVVNSDVIEPDLFGQTIKDSIALKSVLISVQERLAAILKTSREIASSSSFASTKGIGDTTTAYDNATKAGKGYENTVDLIAKAEKRLDYALSEKGKKLAEINLKIQEANKANKEAINGAKEEAKAVNDTRGAYQKKSQNLSSLIKQYQDLAVVNKQNTVEGMALLRAIQMEDTALKNIDATVGRHGRSVGNYSVATQQLRGSIGQIARELPSLSNGLAIFFSAIGNNIAPASDAIEKFREEQKALAAEGKATQSVLSGIGSAVFSFNTLLLLGVTVLTVFGAKLFEGAQSMLGFGDNTKKAKEEQERLNKELDRTIEKVNTIIEDQKDEISFQTDALVIIEKKKQEALIDQMKTSAKERGVIQEEIEATEMKMRIEFRKINDEIESKGRKKEIAKLQDDLDRKNQLYFKALADQKEANRLLLKDEGEFSDASQKFKDLKIAADQRFDKIDAETKKAQSALDRAIAKDRLNDRRDELELQEAENEAEKAAREAKEKRMLADLEHQHHINVLTIEALKDTIVKKKFLLEEEVNYQLAVNKILIKDTKKRIEIQDAIEKKYQRDLIEMHENMIEDMRDAKKFVAEDTKDQKTYESAQKYYYDQAEKLRKANVAKNKKAKKDELDEEKKFINALNTSYVDAAHKRQQAEDRAIDRELTANQKRQDALRALSLKGSQSATENLAFEQRKEAELEKRRIENEKKKARTELISTALKAYAANVGKDPNTATQKTLSDITVLIAAINAIPAFFEGTEDTGKGGDMDGKGGFLAINHPNERIMSADKNRKTRKKDGSLMTNEELADLAYRQINLTTSDKLPMANNYHDDLAVNEIRGLRKDIIQIKSVIENRPVKSSNWDSAAQMVVDIIDTKSKQERTYYKPKLGGRRG